MSAEVDARLTAGARGEVVHTDHVDGFGTVTVRVLDPDGDLDLLHRWVTADRARFWGLQDLDAQELRDLYAYVDGLTTHHAYLVCRDGDPFALIQTYVPEHDPVGEYYDPEPGDVGLHLFLGEHVGTREQQWAVMLQTFVGFVLGPASTRRIVVEPDVRNVRVLRVLERLGFTGGAQVSLPGKTARLAFLERTRADHRLARMWADLHGAASQQGMPEGGHDG
ncbi:GNAT family N-acetyltransferase [Mumia quercus]|uniref:GNAT family N-acetyltransferase n=1 Tax=Mumia quercus TaxID=2976125 RepID=UPI0021CF8532|nr:GNAT family N-acetyltransferase [Mumia quercus]